MQCIDCPTDSVPNCGTATCASRTGGIQCLSCTTRVENQVAWVLNSQNTCTSCAADEYRSGPMRCSTCAKTNTCAAATCQPNSGVTRITGQASMKSYYGPAVNGITLSQYLARYGDGVIGFNPTGIHSGTNAAAGDTTWPWLQVDLGASTTMSMRNMVLYNRDGTWGCRTFAPNDRNCNQVRTIIGRVWNGPNQGAILGLSDTPLTSSTNSVPSTMCTGPTSRNCRCGFLSVYSFAQQGVGPYNVSCNGASGRYAYIILPGANRMLNFGELGLWGTYTPSTSAYSFCTTPCSAAACNPGSARCSGNLTTAVCLPNGCTSTITNGVAFGYNSATQQCEQCSASQCV